MKKRLGAIGLALALGITMTGCTQGGAENTENPQEPIYTAGVYEAEAQGFGGTVSVSITVDETKITDVQVVGAEETDGVGSKAVEQLPQSILSAQSAEVDGVSGATMTSNAVLWAAQQAINAAKGIVAEKEMTPGTYQAQVLGFNFEPVVVSVTVSGTAIEEIEVLEHDGNPGIGSEAVAQMPQRILDAQSIAVDVVSGATVTSRNILTCVTDALEQAGADIGAFSKQAETSEAVSALVKTDVVVVGSGMAGMSAAIEAAQAGAQVVMLEQQSIIGGSTVTCGGAIYATGSSLNKEQDNDPKGMADYWYMKSKENADYDLLYLVAENSGAVVDWLCEMGVEFKTPVSSSGDISAPRAHWTVTGGTYSNGGIDFVSTMTKRMEELGVTILLDTQATELITDESGAVGGVLAHSKTTDYTFESKAVVLATGGFDGDREFFDTYTVANEDVVMFGESGNDGEGIRMAESIGAQTKYNGYTSGLRCVDPTAPSHKSKVGRIVFANTPSITEEGVRFVNETCDYPLFTKAMENVVLDTGKTGFFQLWDSDYTDSYDIEFCVEQGFGYKADTIAELAELAGIPVETLEQTVATYNAMAENGGVDTEFGTENIQPIDQAPFYLTTLYRAEFATYGGLVTDQEARVLNGNGLPIEGLYAAGECACGDFFGDIYPGSGAAISICAVMGRIAGSNAAYASAAIAE